VPSQKQLKWSQLKVGLTVTVASITLAVLIALALLSYSPHDSSFNVASQAPESHPARNWIGPAGAYGADVLFQVFGYAAFLLPMGICVLGLRWFRSHPLDSAIATLVGYAMMVLSVPSLLALWQLPDVRGAIPPGGVAIPSGAVTVPSGGVTVLLGFRDAAHAAGAALLEGARIATDDGSVGHHGLVTELLEDELDRDADREVYACGPPPMLEATARICAERAVPAQLALEAGMACGFGACYGCVVATRHGYVRLCIDGPVLDAALLVPAAEDRSRLGAARH